MAFFQYLGGNSLVSAVGKLAENPDGTYTAELDLISKDPSKIVGATYGGWAASSIWMNIGQYVGSYSTSLDPATSARIKTAIGMLSNAISSTQEQVAVVRKEVDTDVEPEKVETGGVFDPGKATRYITDVVGPAARTGLRLIGQAASVGSDITTILLVAAVAYFMMTR